jgi:glycogen operon protein
MLLHGDEVGRTQRGNNNAYCQDSELTWIDWEHADHGLFEFTRKLITLRKRHPVLRRRRWFHGMSIRGSELRDIGWFRPDGTDMKDTDWSVPFARALGVFLNGDGIPSRGEQGERIRGPTLFVLFNAHFEKVDFQFPPVLQGDKWKTVLDTASIGKEFEAVPRDPKQPLSVESRSVQVLERIDE